MGPFNVVVTVPVTGIRLDKAHSTFHQTTSKKTFAPKGIRMRVSDSIHFPSPCGLPLQIKNTGNLGLHPISEFVGRHPGFEFTGFLPSLLMLRIELGEQVEVGSLPLPGHSLRRTQIENEPSLWP